MLPANLATKNEVIGKLRIAGFSMKEFAVLLGFEPDTVRKVISRYAGRRKSPRGALAQEILHKLMDIIKT